MSSMYYVATVRIIFFKQKTAYEMRIGDWSSDVCSSDLAADQGGFQDDAPGIVQEQRSLRRQFHIVPGAREQREAKSALQFPDLRGQGGLGDVMRFGGAPEGQLLRHRDKIAIWRSEEHTSELQSLMRISYAVFCLKKKKI